MRAAAILAGAVNWSRQLGTPWAATAENCPEVPSIPYAGVTSTPVYDPATGVLYVAGTVSGPPGDDAHQTTATPQFDMFAINASSGALDWQQAISGAATNNSSRTFNAATELQRASLLLLKGSVYMGFGSYCEPSPAPYYGFIAGVNVATTAHATTLWTDEAGSGGNAGGIWQSGGGFLSDGTGIFSASGNGAVPPSGATGSSAPGNLGESVVRLSINGNGSLQASDFFSPGNADQLNLSDSDLGSGGPVGLPFGTSTYPHLIAMAGKSPTTGRVPLASRG